MWTDTQENKHEVKHLKNLTRIWTLVAVTISVLQNTTSGYSLVFYPGYPSLFFIFVFIFIWLELLPLWGCSWHVLSPTCFLYNFILTNRTHVTAAIIFNTTMKGYNKNKGHNYVFTTIRLDNSDFNTTDKVTKGLGATLWIINY